MTVTDDQPIDDQPTTAEELIEKHGRPLIEELAADDNIAAQAVPDGGQTQPVRVGDHVTDAEEDDDVTMVVVERTGHTATEYRLDGSQKTVADVNPGYPATDDVVEVVYPQRETERLADLKQYAFPESRLQVTAPVHDQDEFEGMK